MFAMVISALVIVLALLGGASLDAAAAAGGIAVAAVWTLRHRGLTRARRTATPARPLT